MNQKMGLPRCSGTIGWKGEISRTWKTLLRLEGKQIQTNWKQGLGRSGSIGWVREESEGSKHRSGMPLWIHRLERGIYRNN